MEMNKLGKGDKWRKGHSPNKISENMDKVKKTVDAEKSVKEIIKKKGKTTYVY